jgi:hypothetical protein
MKGIFFHAPCVLPAHGPGMPVALPHAALRLAAPLRRVTPRANRTRAAQAQTQGVSHLLHEALLGMRSILFLAKS